MDREPWTREDVTEILVEELGFTPDPDAPSTAFLRGDDLMVHITDGYGAVSLLHNKPLWSATFTSSTPAHIILGAVREAIADCPNCGTLCDGHAPDVTVGGEVI